MPKFGTVGTYIKEEEFLEIHELKAEQILSSEEKKDLSELLDFLKKLKNAFNAILSDNYLSNPNAIARPGEDGLFFRRMIAALRNPQDERYNLEPRLIQVGKGVYDLGKGKLDEALPRLYRMISKAKELSRIIVSIEKKELKLSHLPWQKGRKIIRKIIRLEEDQRKNLRRKVVGLGETRNMLVSNRKDVGDIYLNIKNEIDTFRILKNYIERTPWQAINERYMKNEIENYRKHLNNTGQIFDKAIENLENVINDVEDFKHWLVHSVHESQRALKFQKKADEILERSGIDQYRDGADRTFGEPWL